MAAAGVVALELIVDLRGCAERLFKAVCSYKRSGTVHLVEVLYLLRDVDIRSLIVKLLLNELLAEYYGKLLGCHGLACAGVEQRSGLVFHISPEVIPF